jgi:hypothetical protein
MPFPKRASDRQRASAPDDYPELPDCLRRAPPSGVRPPRTADVEVCAQCKAADPGPLLHVLVAEGEVRLHRECRRFWLRDHPQPKDTVIACVHITEAVTRALQ